MRLRIDSLSFWFGFIVASIFWWMVSALRPAVKEWQGKIRAKKENARLRDLGGMENRLREIILRQAQKAHLAGSLFSLDEIALEPRLLAPFPNLPPAEDEEAAQEREAILAAYLDDIGINTVPNLPDFPEMGVYYGAPALSLPEALQYGADIALVARLGYGKSSAFAWLASKLARQDQDLPESLQNKVGFIVHASETLPPAEEIQAEDAEQLLKPIIRATTKDASLRHQNNLAQLIREIFQQGRALLLFDGLDEMPRQQTDQAVRYLASLKKAFPQTQIIAAATTDYLDGLIRLRMQPLALRPWNQQERRAFIMRWGRLWEEYIVPESWAQELPPHVEPALLNAWLDAHDDWISPLELTLRVWGLYAGDIQGPTPEDAIYTHLRRLLPEKVPFLALENLGLQAVLNQMPSFQSRDLKKWLAKFEEALAESEAASPEAENADESAAAEAKNVSVKPPRSLVDRLLETGLLVRGEDDRIRFTHPLFGAFLAGRAAAHVNVQAALTKQAPWSLQTQTLYYLAHYGNPSQALETLLKKRQSPLERPLLQTARWLRTAPANAPWRKPLLTELARLLTNPDLSITQRGQIASALGLSRIAGIHQLFIRQLQHNHPDILQISALGIGLSGHPDAVQHLEALLGNPNPRVYRAACLALAAIGTDSALESLVGALLSNHDGLRQAAAEALANHVAEGHPTLQDAAQRTAPEDAPLRRAAVYGLARIREPWAEALLDQLQYDEEWVVRNSAVALVEARQKTNPFIPAPLTPPAKTPWLLAFAARQGKGIAPNQDPTEILLQVLETGEPEEKWAVLPYLRAAPTQSAVSSLYRALQDNDDPDFREAVYRTLCWIETSGFSLPSLQR